MKKALTDTLSSFFLRQLSLQCLRLGGVPGPHSVRSTRGKRVEGDGAFWGPGQLVSSRDTSVK